MRIVNDDDDAEIRGTRTPCHANTARKSDINRVRACVGIVADGLRPDVGGAQGDAAAHAVVGGHLDAASSGRHGE